MIIFGQNLLINYYLNNTTMSEMNEQQNTTPEYDTTQSGSTQSMFGNTMNEQPAKPDNYLVMAIVATVLGLCSCLGLILGIVAIVFATQVDSKYNLGDYMGAQSASKNAKLFSIIALVVDGLGIIFSIVYYAIVGAAAFGSYM
jgi:hypothetical protein